MARRPKVLEVEFMLPALPKDVYAAWMSSKTHAAMTGGAAEIDPHVGGQFTAWDGYIEGKTLELERGKRVVQSWRTSDFAPNDADSKIEVLFEAKGSGTRVRLLHHGLSASGRKKYESGWADFYVKPLQAYFRRRSAALAAC